MLFLAPFVAIIALVTYADVHSLETWDNTIAGRLLSAGSSLLSLNPWQVLGLQVSSEFTSGYAGGYAGDSGYGYALVKVGLLGLAGIWGLFVYAPVFDRDAWRFKIFVTFYIVLLLAVSASLFSIKTSALLWFLYGTLNNPNRSASMSRLATHADISSESA
jgi:putative polymerase